MFLHIYDLGDATSSASSPSWHDWLGTTRTRHRYSDSISHFLPDLMSSLSGTESLDSSISFPQKLGHFSKWECTRVLFVTAKCPIMSTQKAKCKMRWRFKEKVFTLKSNVKCASHPLPFPTSLIGAGNESWLTSTTKEAYFECFQVQGRIYI